MLLDELLDESAIPGQPPISDEYLCDRQKWVKIWQRVRSQLKEDPPVPFEISNVAAYFYEGTTKEEWDFSKDFPGALPPFQRTWMEWTMPAHINTNGTLEEIGPWGGTRIGTSLTMTSESGDHMMVLIDQFWQTRKMHRCVVDVSTIISIRKRDGAIVEHSGEGFHKPTSSSHFIPGLKDYTNVNETPEIVEACSNARAACFPMLLALSLLNCRNVKTREIQVERQQRRHAARHHIPIIPAYHVIEIQPFIQSTTRTTGQSGYTREAAKIVRGHFKDYTQGEGLFGHIKERFWWNQQLRGPVKRDFHYEYREAHGGRLDKGWLKRPARRRA